MEKINDTNYELWLLRYAEDELTTEERVAVEQWLESHPAAAEELALYNEAPRLEKDESVRYAAAMPHQTVPLWPAVMRWSAAAAVVAALMVPAIGGITKMEKVKPFDGQVAQVQSGNEVCGMRNEEVETTVNERPVAHPTVVLPQEEVMVAEVIEEEEAPVVEEPTELLAQEEPEVVPEVVYCDNLIAYESAPDTVYTNNLIAYEYSRRLWTEDVKDWASETKVAQWVRRRLKARESEMLAMND